MFIFICFQIIFYLFLDISLINHSLLNNMVFSLHVFGCVWVFHWSWFLVSCHYDLRKCLMCFQCYWNCLDLFCVLTCGPYLRMLHVHLRRMYILLLWEEMFSKYKLSPFNPVSHLWSLFLDDFLSGRSIYWGWWGLKIPYYDCITVNVSLKVHQDFLYIFRCFYIA